MLAVTLQPLVRLGFASSVAHFKAQTTKNFKALKWSNFKKWWDFSSIHIYLQWKCHTKMALCIKSFGLNFHCYGTTIRISLCIFKINVANCIMEIPWYICLQSRRFSYLREDHQNSPVREKQNSPKWGEKLFRILYSISSLTKTGFSKNGA